jgi:hypothetical protein
VAISLEEMKRIFQREFSGPVQGSRDEGMEEMVSRVTALGYDRTDVEAALAEMIEEGVISYAGGDPNVGAGPEEAAPKVAPEPMNLGSSDGRPPLGSVPRSQGYGTTRGQWQVNLSGSDDENG